MKVVEKIQKLVGPIKTLLCIVVFHAMEMKDEAWMGGFRFKYRIKKPFNILLPMFWLVRVVLWK